MSRYRMRRRLLSIGDDYWIEAEDGKALRIRKTLVLAITVCIDATSHPRD